MPPPPSPPRNPPTVRNPSTTFATSSRALLGQLEELRDNLGTRVEQLSRAVERLRIQAGEIERALRENNLDLTRLSSGDGETSPAVTATTSSRPVLSGVMTAQRLDRTARGLTRNPRRLGTPSAFPTEADEGQPISQERLDEILESAVAGPVVTLPSLIRVPDLATDPLRGYIPIPISAGELTRMSTLARDENLPGGLDSSATNNVQNRNANARPRTTSDDRGEWAQGVSTSSNVRTRFYPYDDEVLASLSRHNYGSQYRLPPAVAVSPDHRAPGGQPVRAGSARPAATTARRNNRDTRRTRHPASAVERGLKPTNLLESGKTKPIIVKSQPLSPSRTITPDDHIREDLLPLEGSGSSERIQPATAAEIALGPRPAGADRTSMAWARLARELVQTRADNSQRFGPGPDLEPDAYTAADSGLTLRGQEVAAREAGTASPTSSDIPYDMDDFERDYYLDFDNDLGAAVVAPGTGFAMPSTGSPIGLPQLGQRATTLPTGRTVAEVVDTIRREEGERMRALATDIVRHRPHTPSALSREATPGFYPRGAAAPIGRNEDGSRTPRADLSEAAALAARFTLPTAARRARLSGRNPEASGGLPALNAGPRTAESSGRSPDPRDSAASTPIERLTQHGAPSGATNEMRDRHERTLAAQVHVEITRDRVRSVARAAAAASEMGAQRLETLREFFLRMPESDYADAIPSYIPGIDPPPGGEEDVPQSGLGQMERALGVATTIGEGDQQGGLRRDGLEGMDIIAARHIPQEVDLAGIGSSGTEGQGVTSSEDPGGVERAEVPGSVLEGQGEASTGLAVRAAGTIRSETPIPQSNVDGVLRGSTAVSAQLDGDLKPILDEWAMPTGRSTPRPYVSLLDL